MKELIKIEQTDIGGAEVNSVNGRDLHKALEVNKKYPDWIKNQIESLKLEEYLDYIFASPKREAKGRGGHNAIEYLFTVDIAKHISLASRTAKGKEVRAYFIAVEKEATKQKELPKMSELDLIIAVANETKRVEVRLQNQDNRLEVLEEKIKTPEVIAVGVLPPSGYVSSRELANRLGVSTNFAKKMIRVTKATFVECTKLLDIGVTNSYKAYEFKTLKKEFKKIFKNSPKTSEQYYTHPKLGKFQCRKNK